MWKGQDFHSFCKFQAGLAPVCRILETTSGGPLISWEFALE